MLKKVLLSFTNTDGLPWLSFLNAVANGLAIKYPNHSQSLRRMLTNMVTTLYDELTQHGVMKSMERISNLYNVRITLYAVSLMGDLARDVGIAACTVPPSKEILIRILDTNPRRSQMNRSIEILMSGTKDDPHYDLLLDDRQNLPPGYPPMVHIHEVIQGQVVRPIWNKQMQSDLAEDMRPIRNEQTPSKNHGVSSENHGVPSENHGVPSENHGVPPENHATPSDTNCHRVRASKSQMDEVKAGLNFVAERISVLERTRTIHNYHTISVKINELRKMRAYMEGRADVIAFEILAE